MARETETERHQPEAETAPPQGAAQEERGGLFGWFGGGQTDGQTASDRAFGGPQAGGPEIDATKQAMVQHVVGGMQRANVEPGSGGQNDLTHGIHYWYNYQSQCQRAGKPEL